MHFRFHKKKPPKQNPFGLLSSKYYIVNLMKTKKQNKKTIKTENVHFLFVLKVNSSFIPVKSYSIYYYTR